ncbi:MAG: 3-phytase [Candidatus Parabeggiatoa sp. nov. 1]|nr:MAG: 3-phytase [Gammaproteobacteria bacterium]
MRAFLIFSLVIVLTGVATRIRAQQSPPSLDSKQGILNLPQVIVIPENSTFSATLRQIESSELVLELDSITSISGSFSYYDPNKKILYLPALTIGDETYQNVQFELVTPQTEPLRFRMVAADIDKTALKKVSATVETKPVPASGDAADDPAIWVHPLDPAKSTILGTQKQGGLGVYDLAGQEVQYLADGNMNNVDLKYNFSLGGENVTIVAASNRSNDSIALYKINPGSRMLENVAARTIRIGLKHAAYGLCMYHSKLYDKYYVFINDKSGAVEQWEIFDNGSGLADATRVRSFEVNSQVEGCVADDALAHFYLGEERVGIWKFSAEPDGGSAGYLIDTTDKNGNITPEVEGLAIYYASETEGYLIASNQGNNTYTVYNRAGDNEYLGKFQIVADETLNIDNVYDTDGIDVVNVSLGEAFPYGVFVAQDGKNIDPEENQNFKLVPWEYIAKALNLKIEPSYSPR